MTYDFNVLNQICYIFCIFLPPPVYIYFDLSLTFWLFSGGWHDQHWTDWNNKWYMRVQWQWINAARFGWKPDTFILHTCSGACSQMVFLPRKFNGLISRCYWLLFLKFCLKFIPIGIFILLVGIPSWLCLYRKSWRRVHKQPYMMISNFWQRRTLRGWIWQIWLVLIF